MGSNRPDNQFKTAAELMRELQGDPVWRAEAAKREQERSEAVAQRGRMIAPLLEELRAAGENVASLDDLRHSPKPYRAAVPILLRWLTRIEDVVIKEDIVRTLSVPWARSAAPTLIQEFEQADVNGGLKWAIASGLAVVADDSVMDDLLSLIGNKGSGKAREMLVLALANMTDSRVVPTLIELLSDEEVVGHAVIALGRLKAVEAYERIELLIRHSKPWVRREARKALARIVS